MAREWTRRRAYLLAGTAAILAAAAGLAFAAVDSGHASQIGGAQVVTSVIVLDPYLRGETFAPPPAGVTPALTAHQAAVRGERLRPGKPIPASVTVQLGVFTLPVGPRSGCDNDCHADTFVDGIAYSSYRVLVYGFSRSWCPGGSPGPTCSQWDFISANTGRYVAGLGPAPKHPAGPHKKSRKP